MAAPTELVIRCEMNEDTMEKLTATDPETKSPDLAAANLAALRALFPALVTEGPDGGRWP